VIGLAGHTWAPVAAIATGVVVSIAWTLYNDLELFGSIRQLSWIRVATILILWGGLTSLLISRVSWARAACRAFAALTVVGSLVSLWFGGGDLFLLVEGLRSLCFAAVFILLPAPVPSRPPPIWMQPTYRAVAQRLLECRQSLERFGHAQAFFRPSGFVSKKPFYILGERAVPEMDHRLAPLRNASVVSPRLVSKWLRREVCSRARPIRDARN
jgi:hypothetical protein